MTNLGIHVIDVSCEKANFIPTLIPILGQPIAMQSIQWPWCKCMWWNWRNFSFSQNANDVNTFNTSVNLKIFRIDCAERHFTTEKRRFLIWHLVLYIPFDKCELKWRRRIVTQSVGLGKNAFIGKLCVCVCVRDFPWLFERDKISCILNMSNTFKIQTPQQSTLFLFQVIKCDFVVTNSNIVARSFWVFQ